MSGGDHDNDAMLQAKLADLEDEVKTLRLEKNKLEQLLQKPVEFNSVVSGKCVARTGNSQKHIQQFESMSLLKKLMLHRLSGKSFYHILLTVMQNWVMSYGNNYSYFFFHFF
jgi:hypothetical protein